jgi:CubicO group peptidase (beta-lactamase class C family)
MRRRLRVWGDALLLAFALVAIAAASTVAYAARPPNNALSATRIPTDEEKTAFILEVMRGGGIPGLQAVVVKDGKVIWHRSYGYSVLAQPGPRTPMRDDSLLFSASVAKMITVTAVMQQVEKGRISLDDDISKYVPFTLRNPKWPDVPITWRMLLTHTSSVDVDQSVEDSVYFYGSDSPVSLEEYVEGMFIPGGRYFRPDSFRPGKPGTERIYSDAGFDLVGYALARVVKQPFAEYVHDAILVPLRMKESAYSLRKIPADKLAVGYGRTLRDDGRWAFASARVAFAHLPDGRTVLEDQMGIPDPPTGGLYTSATQFAQLLLMFLNHGTLDGAKVLEPSSVDLLTTHTGYFSIFGYQQGLALMGTRDLDDHLVWGHDGQDRGYCTAAYFDRESGVGVVAFANANRDDELLSRRLVDLDMHMLDWFK